MVAKYHTYCTGKHACIDTDIYRTIRMIFTEVSIPSSRFLKWIWNLFLKKFYGLDYCYAWHIKSAYVLEHTAYCKIKGAQPLLEVINSICVCQKVNKILNTIDVMTQDKNSEKS
jgi:hypothetical protein